MKKDKEGERERERETSELHLINNIQSYIDKNTMNTTTTKIKYTNFQHDRYEILKTTHPFKNALEIRKKNYPIRLNKATFLIH